MSSSVQGSAEDVPIFPIEIERVIVDMVTENIIFPLRPRSGATYLNVQLAAKRFREWIMPVIFRVLDTGTIQRYRASIGFQFVEDLATRYGRATKHILFRTNAGYISPEDQILLRRLLENCTNVEDLVIWVDYESDSLPILHGSIQNLFRLDRFSGNSQHILRGSVLVSPIDINLTHLDVMDPVTFAFLAQFHNLIHLCINDYTYDWQDLLTQLQDNRHSACRSLQFITGIDVDEATDNNPDERYVELAIAAAGGHVTSWFDGVNGGMDLWEFSKRIVVARKRGYMLKSMMTRRYNMQMFEVDAELTADGQRWWQQLDITMRRTSAKGREWWRQA